MQKLGCATTARLPFTQCGIYSQNLHSALCRAVKMHAGGPAGLVLLSYGEGGVSSEDFRALPAGPLGSWAVASLPCHNDELSIHTDLPESPNRGEQAPATQVEFLHSRTF